MRVTIAIFVIAAILATTVVVTTTTIQQASADKVGPNCKPDAPKCREDQLTQGGLGEFFSNEGKNTYYGVEGNQFGDVRSDFASSDSEVIGANSAYYASGECHSDREPKACR